LGIGIEVYVGEIAAAVVGLLAGSGVAVGYGVRVGKGVYVGYGVHVGAVAGIAAGRAALHAVVNMTSTSNIPCFMGDILFGWIKTSSCILIWTPAIGVCQVVGQSLSRRAWGAPVTHA